MTRGPSLVILETDLESLEAHSRQASKGSREIPPLLSPYVPRAAPSLVTQLGRASRLPSTKLRHEDKQVQLR